MESVYLDHQASTPVDPRVAQQMSTVAGLVYGNPHSADHSVGWTASATLDEATEGIATRFSCSPDELVFTSGATEANNLAILGVAQAARASRRQRVIVSNVEHGSVTDSARASADFFGFDVLTAPVDCRGCVDLAWLSDHVDDTVALVSVIAVSNEIGTIQDLNHIAEITRGAGALVHADCAQAPFAVDFEVITRAVDLASFSGHKMCGPKGIGILFVERSSRPRIQPIIHGGGQQQNLRSGTVPVPLVCGIAEAIRLTHDGRHEERPRLSLLRDALIDGLRARSIEFSVNTPISAAAHPGNASILFRGVDARDLLQRLQPGVAASTGSACTSGTPEPSHVLRAIGLTVEEAESCVRFSVGRSTTADDISVAVQRIADALQSALEL
jgi:cysteine desulfurase